MEGEVVLGDGGVREVEGIGVVGWLWIWNHRDLKQK